MLVHPTLACHGVAICVSLVLSGNGTSVVWGGSLIYDCALRFHLMNSFCFLSSSRLVAFAAYPAEYMPVFTVPRLAKGKEVVHHEQKRYFSGVSYIVSQIFLPCQAKAARQCGNAEIKVKRNWMRLNEYCPMGMRI